MSWDAEGRPSCIHGRAIRANGTRWRCPERHRIACRKWMATESGRDYLSRRAASDAQKSSKQLYELTRVRAR